MSNNSAKAKTPDPYAEEMEDLADVGRVIDEWSAETGAFEDGEKSYAEIVTWLIRRVRALAPADDLPPDVTEHTQGYPA